MMVRSLLLIGVVAIAAAPAAAQQMRDTRITIYANGLALVDAARTLPAGAQTVQIDNVAPQMIADSLRIEVPASQQVREISLDADILSQQALLERSLGQTIKIARTNPATGEDIIEDAVVLSVRGGLVLKIGERIETTLPGRLIFDAVPDDLVSEPTVRVTFAEPLTEPLSARLAYLTNGMNWETVYTAVMDATHTEMDLEGWAKITNAAGLDLSEARISVVAGDVARASAPRPGRVLMRAEAASMAADAPAPGIAPQPLSAFHLYDIPGPVTLRDNETKQFYLVGADAIATKRVLEYRGGAPVFGPVRAASRPEAVRQRIEVANSADNRLGVPLPAGIVRAYVRGADQRLRFIGEDRTGNIPAGEELRLNLGRAFDVTVKRTQTDFRRVGDRVTEAAFRLTIKNGGATSADVAMIEDIPGDWEMLSESASHTREGPSANWSVSVPPEGAVDLTYRVRVRR